MIMVHNPQMDVIVPAAIMDTHNATMDPNDKNTSSPTNDGTWFRGKSLPNARKYLKRWTEDYVPNNMKTCGNIYGHYLNYKIMNVLHKTKRGGVNNFFDCYRQHGYYLLKDVFRPRFLEVMKQELLSIFNLSELSWQDIPVSNSQVKLVIFKKPLLCQCEFLHNFILGVIAGCFPKKTFY